MTLRWTRHVCTEPNTFRFEKADDGEMWMHALVRVTDVSRIIAITIPVSPERSGGDWVALHRKGSEMWWLPSGVYHHDLPRMSLYLLGIPEGTIDAY